MVKSSVKDNKPQKLNERQKAFCQAYATCHNAKKAYEIAGYAATASIKQNAYRLLQNPLVLQTIKQIKAKNEEKASIKIDVQRDECIENARWLIKHGKEKNRYGSVAKGNEQLCKIAGIFSESLNFNNIQRQRVLDELEKAEADRIARLALKEIVGGVPALGPATAIPVQSIVKDVQNVEQSHGAQDSDNQDENNAQVITSQ